MNTLDFQYQNLLQHILDDGSLKQTRNGKTYSVFGAQLAFDMKEGLPLLTTKKIAFKTMVAELLWFLQGRTDLRYLLENNCNIWNGDAFKNYISNTNEYKGNWPDTIEDFINRIKTDDNFAKEWGDLGPIYGKQWREWKTPIGPKMDGQGSSNYYTSIDQIKNLIFELRTNPNSRRLMVSAWNVGELDKMVLPPCHHGFQCYVRDETYLSLMWNQRSVDVPLGLPFNIASYGLLLEILAKQVDMIPDMLIANLGDCHIYENQKDGVIEQLGRTEHDNLPYVVFHKKDIDEYEVDDFVLKDYVSHPSIYFPLSN